MTCGEKITINKKRKNFKQEQFAELLNVSRQSKTIIAKTWTNGIAVIKLEQ